MARRLTSRSLSLARAELLRYSNISDYFAAANGLGPAPGADNILLFQRGFNMVGQAPGANWSGPGPYVAQDFTHTFTSAQLAALALFISQGNNLAFGFDPDCHYWNNGITLRSRHSPYPSPPLWHFWEPGSSGRGFTSDVVGKQKQTVKSSFFSISRIGPRQRRVWNSTHSRRFLFPLPSTRSYTRFVKSLRIPCPFREVPMLLSGNHSVSSVLNR